MKRATMELGGHAPAIVFDDADVDVGREDRWRRQSSATPARSASRRPASWCRKSVYDELRRQVRRRRQGGQGRRRPGRRHRRWARSPMPRRVAAMEGIVAGRRQQGRASCATGGNRIGNKGYFFEPTVLTDVPNDARAMNEEPFGPLALISPFSKSRRGGRGGQPAALRPRRLRLHELGQDRDRDRRAGRDRHDVDQQLRPRAARGAVRRRQGFRLRLRGRHEAIEAYLNTKFVTQAGV